MTPMARPIVCSEQTACELRDSRRWQLRRPVALRGLRFVGTAEELLTAERSEPLVMCSNSRGEPVMLRCPFGRSDDWLWVQERWRVVRRHGERIVQYEADRPDGRAPWVPAALMPERSARMWLRIYRVRAQRLHEVSAFDQASEVRCPEHDTSSSYCQGECELRRRAFLEAWDRRWGRTAATAASNPLVWAISVIRYTPSMARAVREQDGAGELEGYAARARQPLSSSTSQRRAARR